MKNIYQIHEVSQLYGIGVDSLRYYEKLGILHPRRDTNGYRLYHLKDLYKLNIIRDLRQLHFSMAQIKDYLDGQNLSQTLTLLGQEESLLQQQLDAGKRRQQVLRQRIAALETARDLPAGEVRVQTLPPRRGVLLSQRITRDEEMDFVVKKLQRCHEAVIPHLGNQEIGAFFDPQALAQGQFNVFDSVFILVGGAFADEDSADGESADGQSADGQSADGEVRLGGGAYLTCRYRGDYTQNARCWQAMTVWAKKEGLTLSGTPFELYLVDNRETVRPEEFLTEIQVRVTPLSM